jgi:hypothetical protein
VRRKDLRRPARATVPEDRTPHQDPFLQPLPSVVEKYADAWGGIDDLSPTDDTAQATPAAATTTTVTREKPDGQWLRRQEERRQAPRIRYDQESYDLIKAGHAIHLDPAEYGLTVEDVRLEFHCHALRTRDSLEGEEHEWHRAMYADIFVRRDLQGMGAHLGREMLFLLHRDKERPAWIDATEPQRKEKVISAVELRKRLEKLSRPNNAPAVYAWN